MEKKTNWQEYKFGTRDNRMIKLKMFEDHEYKILDLVDGGCLLLD